MSGTSKRLGMAAEHFIHGVRVLLNVPTTVDLMAVRARMDSAMNDVNARELATSVVLQDVTARLYELEGLHRVRGKPRGRPAIATGDITQERIIGAYTAMRVDIPKPEPPPDGEPE